ncbi:MAG TPA: DUF1232 domain-containing protein [Myxococcota bacterium]|jgi:uncharacterized membrane protein YkvA (DUF1232 family)|nr:DUF1232 domain-containing protein [Myxococcota bacterium]
MAVSDTRAVARRSRAGQLPFVGTLRSMVRFFADGRAPLLPKLVLGAAVAYLVLPIDLLPDAIPVVGWLDDLGVVGVAWTIFKRYLTAWEDE